MNAKQILLGHIIETGRRKGHIDMPARPGARPAKTSRELAEELGSRSALLWLALDRGEPMELTHREIEICAALARELLSLRWEERHSPAGRRQ